MIDKIARKVKAASSPKILTAPLFIRRAIHRLLASVLYRRNLVIIHIGKTGGGTVRALLKQHDMLDRYSIVHTFKPWYHPNKQYIITLRDPIERAISSYQWRYYKLVQKGVQQERFKNEFQALQNYRKFLSTR